MRFESSVLSVSWIPSEAISGMTRLPFNLGITSYDSPPPDRVTDPSPLLAADEVRFANQLSAWVDVEDGLIVDHGYTGRGHINVSTVRFGGQEIRFAAMALPDIQREPQLDGDAIVFTQTAGGRTGIPAPRRVNRKPFVQVVAPLAWTTLSLTIDANGKSEGQVVGASPFPRHWIYDKSGQLVAKTGAIDFESWYREAFGKNTPWGDTDSPALVSEVETALERQISLQIMKGQKPSIQRLAAGDTLVEQGDAGDSIFALLDGMLAVEVDGEAVADLGPGAIVGERAVLEGGQRTSTLRATTACRVAVASPEQIDLSALAKVSEGHRREKN